MNNPTFDTFFSTLEEIGRAIVKSAKYAVDAISAMSWPVMLLTCVALALLMTLLPLIVGLFVVFMAIKLAAACFADRKRGAVTPHKDVVVEPDLGNKGE